MNPRWQLNLRPSKPHDRTDPPARYRFYLVSAAGWLQGHYGVSPWNGGYHLFYRPGGHLRPPERVDQEWDGYVSQPEKVSIDIVEDYQRATTTTKSALALGVSPICPPAPLIHLPAFLRALQKPFLPKK